MTLLTAADYTQFPYEEPDHRYAYGADPQQFGELYLPASPPPHSIIVLAHGGCYYEFYDLKPIGGMARTLANAGFAVWNIEYRRAGNGGDFPNMFLDVAAAADHLRQIAGEHELDLSDAISAGHSAGGHLALWLAGRRNLPKTSPLYREDALPIAGVVAVAAVADIAYAFEQGMCGDALFTVMGGGPVEAADHLRDVSPRELLPLGVPQIHIVGSADETILANVYQYLEAAREAGDKPELFTLEGAGHFEVVAVDRPAWQTVGEAIHKVREAIGKDAPGAASGD